MAASTILFVLVCGIAALNSVFLAVHWSFHRKGNAALNRLLAALLLTFAARVSKTVVVFFVSNLHPLFELAWIAILGLTGPAALLYIVRFAGAASRTAALVIGACVLAAIASVAIALVLPLGVTWKVFGAALALYGSGLVAALPPVVARRRVEQLPRLSSRWLVGIVGFLGMVWVLYVTLVVVRLVGWNYSEDAFFNVEAALFSVAVYALMYGEVRSGLVARLHQAPAGAPIQADDPMLQRLRHAVEVERLYLDPALSLPSLARTLRLTPQHVSRLINAGIGASFNDYVNRLRIEEVRRRLALPDGASRKIGQLGLDCGFNSSSVFYAAFRKFTGKTPSEYLRHAART